MLDVLSVQLAGGECAARLAALLDLYSAPYAARLGVMVAPPPGVDAPSGQMRQVAAIDVMLL